MSGLNVTRRQVLLGAVGLGLVGISGNSAAVARQSSDLQVTATFSILGDWVQRVAGDVLTVATVVPAGGDTHTFDPTPDQMAAISEADLLFANGLGFELWLDGVVKASGTKAKQITVSDGIEVLHFGDDDHEDEESEKAENEHEEDDHDHGSDDPHMWGDVQNAIIAVGAIRDALTAIDKANAATYEANATAYIAELETLDELIRTETATIPADQRKLVTTHDTLAYYAHAYDFEIPGTALSSLSTETGDPSAQAISELVVSIQESGVPAIFAENISSNSLMESIAAEAGVELAPPLFTDALGPADSDGATYVEMMRTNTSIIVSALA